MVPTGLTKDCLDVLVSLSLSALPRRILPRRHDFLVEAENQRGILGVVLTEGPLNSFQAESGQALVALTM